MDKVIIGTALTLLTILAFFGLFIWLMFFNPTGSYSLSLLILGLLVAFPSVFYLYMSKKIEYVFMLIVYSVLAFITLIVAMIAWNPNNIVSDNPGSFSYLMIILASLGGVFGLTAKGTIEKKYGIIAAGSIILFYIASIFLKTRGKRCHFPSPIYYTLIKVGRFMLFQKKKWITTFTFDFRQD